MTTQYTSSSSITRSSTWPRKWIGLPSAAVKVESASPGSGSSTSKSVATRIGVNRSTVGAHISYCSSVARPVSTASASASGARIAFTKASRTSGATTSRGHSHMPGK